MVYLHLLHDTKAIFSPSHLPPSGYRGARSPTEVGKLPEIIPAEKGEEG